MSKWPVARQQRSLNSCYNAGKSFQFSETIFHTLAALRALRAKHRSITYLLNVKIDLSNTSKMIARLLIERHTIHNDSVFSMNHPQTHSTDGSVSNISLHSTFIPAQCYNKLPNTTPEQWLFQNLQDSLRYQPFTIPPHTRSSKSSWLFTQQLSVFLFAIWILEFGKNNSVRFFLIDLLSELFTDRDHFSWGSRSYGFVAIISGISPGEAALMALSP